MDKTTIVITLIFCFSFWMFVAFQTDENNLAVKALEKRVAAIESGRGVAK